MISPAIEVFVPLSVEEKIITHADNLVFEDKEVSWNKVVERFEKELGKEAVKKFIRLKEIVENL